MYSGVHVLYTFVALRLRIKQILGLAVLLVNYALGNLDCGLCNVPTRSLFLGVCVSVCVLQVLMVMCGVL